MTDREKDELAAQVLAIMQARFDPPGPDDTEDILERARRLAQAPAPAPVAAPALGAAPAAVVARSQPPGPAPDMRLVDRCLFAAGALLLAVYFFRLTRPSLHIYFTGDDMMNLYRSWVFSHGHLFNANLLFFLNSDFIRPMGSVWYRAMIDLAGFNPYWFHASNLAILAVNIWLTYVVARRLSGSRQIAALTALAMAYQQRLASLYFDTGYVYDVICYFFLFAALALYMRARSRGTAFLPWQWASLFVLYICALNTKEMALMLPAFLGSYELLYHPPRAWQPATLYRWLLREGRATLLAGAVAVLFVVGRSLGPLSLVHMSAYRPSFTWTQFMLTSRHFLGDFFATPDWPAWTVLLLWAALAAFALVTRSRVLGFAWLYLMLSPLPIAFIEPRGSAQYYVAVFGWMLYAAVLLTKLAAFLTRGLPLAEWWLSRARGAALFLVSMAILYAAYKPLGYADIYSAYETATLYRNSVAQLHSVAPVIRPGSHLLFLRDPVAADHWDLFFMVRLSYNDRNLQVARVKEMKQPPSDQEIASYDYVFDYHDGRFFELKKPGS
jgi:hypothetical protein